MQRIEYIEKMGTGILRMRKMLTEAKLPPIEYEFSSFVRAVFWRPLAVGQLDPVNTPQVPRKYPASTPQVENAVTASVLTFCTTPRSREEIQTHLGLKDREHFQLKILQPLLKSGLLVPTIPEKPNSSKQKYITANEQGN
jgi:ATP-dependent DNA helicase RecG